MKRGDAGRLLDGGHYLTLAERAVYLVLLERADNGTCVVPPRMTPTVPDLAHRCGVTDRSIRRVLVHLDRHGWLAYEPARGRGHRGRFHVAPRRPDPECTCGKPDARVRLSREKSGHQTPGKADIGTPVIPAQDRFSAKGLEGEQLEGPQLPELPDNVTRLRFPSLTSPAAGRRWASGFDN